MIESISIEELKKLSNINLIDIRDKEKYNNGHIMNSKNISFEQLILYPNKYLNYNLRYYIYCQKGIQSRKVCQILTNMGYKTINVSGGYEKWVLY